MSAMVLMFICLQCSDSKDKILLHSVWFCMKYVREDFHKFELHDVTV